MPDGGAHGTRELHTAGRTPGPPMTRVALVSHWDWVLYNFRLPLAKRLRARGLDVTFVCPRGDYVGALQAAGFGWAPWPLSRRGMNPVGETARLDRKSVV